MSHREVSNVFGRNALLRLTLVAALALGIGFMCLEMVIRLIGRGLGAQFSPEATVAQRTTQRWNFR